VELVDRAERSGLVRREHDEKDLRRSLVQLTTKGTTLLERLVLQHLDELVPQCQRLISSLQDLQKAGEDDAGSKA
jgi:DNA-binding MarR family transcriptional regulator